MLPNSVSVALSHSAKHELKMKKAKREVHSNRKRKIEKEGEEQRKARIKGISKGRGGLTWTNYSLVAKEKV